MGRFHVVVEATARDVLKLLERRRVNPLTLQDTKTKLDRLIAASHREEHLERAATDAVPSAVLVHDIVSDLVESVCETKIPYVEQVKAQRALAAQRQELFDLRRQLFERETSEEVEEGQRVREHRAHTTFMSTMFKEVLTLRRQISQLETQNSQLREAFATLRTNMASPGGAPGGALGGRSSSIFMPHGYAHRPSNRASFLAPSPSAAAAAAAAAAATTSPTQQQQPPGSPMVRVSSLANTNAIFDYDEYLALVGGGTGWELRYMELRQQFDSYVERANHNADSLAEAYTAESSARDRRLAVREQQLQHLQELVRDFRPKVMSVVRATKLEAAEELAALRKAFVKMQTTTAGWLKTLSRQVAVTNMRFEVFVRFATQAFQNLAAQVRHSAERRPGAPHVAPLWHFFLLRGTADPLEEGKVFWQSDPRTQMIVGLCRDIADMARDAAQDAYVADDAFAGPRDDVASSRGGGGVQTSSSVGGAPSTFAVRIHRQSSRVPTGSQRASSRQPPQVTRTSDGVMVEDEGLSAVLQRGRTSTRGGDVARGTGRGGGDPGSPSLAGASATVDGSDAASSHVSASRTEAMTVVPIGGHSARGNNLQASGLTHSFLLEDSAVADGGEGQPMPRLVTISSETGENVMLEPTVSKATMGASAPPTPRQGLGGGSNPATAGPRNRSTTAVQHLSGTGRDTMNPGLSVSSSSSTNTTLTLSAAAAAAGAAGFAEPTADNDMDSTVSAPNSSTPKQPPQKTFSKHQSPGKGGPSGSPLGAMLSDIADSRVEQRDAALPSTTSTEPLSPRGAVEADGGPTQITSLEGMAAAGAAQDSLLAGGGLAGAMSLSGSPASPADLAFSPHSGGGVRPVRYRAVPPAPSAAAQGPTKKQIEESEERIACMITPKDATVREKLVTNHRRSGKTVVSRILARVTLRKRREAFFKRLPAAAKNAYAALLSMDEEIERLDDAVDTARKKVAGSGKGLLAFDSAVRANATKRPARGGGLEGSLNNNGERPAPSPASRPSAGRRQSQASPKRPGRSGGDAAHSPAPPGQQPRATRHGRRASQHPRVADRDGDVEGEHSTQAPPMVGSTQGSPRQRATVPMASTASRLGAGRGTLQVEDESGGGGGRMRGIPAGEPLSFTSGTVDPFATLRGALPPGLVTLSGTVEGGSSAEAAAAAAPTSTSSSKAAGMTVLSSSPASPVYVPTPGHVVSQKVAEESKELLLRRGALQQQQQQQATQPVGVNLTSPRRGPATPRRPGGSPRPVGDPSLVV